MEALNVEIKIEPLDEDFPVIKEEELNIKPDLDDEFPFNNSQLGANDLQNVFDLLIPKDEPVDEEYLTVVSPPVEHDENNGNPLPRPPSPYQKVQCEDCKRYFSGANELMHHRRLRCRGNNHVCTVCGQVFRTFLILQDHLQRHKQKSSPGKERKTTWKPKLTTIPPLDPEGVIFACNTCEMTFRSGQRLLDHNRIHGGNNHICNQCGKSFKYAVDLRKHMKGDVCVREAIADVLRNTGSDINIKEEVESEDSENETFTQQMLIGSTIISKIEPPKEQDVIVDQQGNTFVIKKEDLVSEDTIQPALIKEEPVVSEEISTDTQGYNELILRELIDRKAKSIAKEREAVNGSMLRMEKKYFEQTINEDTLRMKSPSLRNTDFEDIITSSTLTLEIRKQRIKMDVIKSEYQAVESSVLDQSLQTGFLEEGEEDFEQMIASNTLPNFQSKIEVIENLKEEYQKAKKKKLDTVSTDESSQHSSSAITVDAAGTLDALPTKGTAAQPCSVYFSLVADPEPYNEVVRQLDKNYRYTWICSSCPRRYVQRHAFMKHLTSTHYKDKSELNDVLFELRPELFCPSLAENAYCHLCRVTLADATSLRKHKKEFHKEDNSTKLQFRCDKCGKYCSTRSTLADHVQANCGTEPQHGCGVCGKKFYTKSTLTLHKTMHTGELPHECCYCEKRFRTRGQLTVHTRTHTGERPFPCKVCDKRFTHRETLIAHLSRHIDMKRYKCYGCQQFFSCISGLKTHRLTRMTTCGLVKLNARPVGPRVRVIKGNVIFEPQPKINPYSRRSVDDCDENIKKNVNFQDESVQNQENLSDLIKIEPISMLEES